MQENPQVVFLSDGGEDIRQVRKCLHPSSEHVIDESSRNPVVNVGSR